jgi:CRP-like cAMP-binding protein
MQSVAKLPFFKDAVELQLDRFDRRCTWRRYDENETVVDYEDESTDVFFIMTGEVRILIRTMAGKEIILGEMRGGQFFGELAAIDGTKRSANVTALTRCEVCIMPAQIFKEIVFASPLTADKLLRMLVTRVRELNARLAEHAIFDLKHRLYSELLRLANPRAGHPGEKVVSPPPFHHVLANRIGCRREQVTRELSAMTQDGIVERTRGALIIRKPEVLEERLAQALRDEG